MKETDTGKEEETIVNLYLIEFMYLCILYGCKFCTVSLEQHLHSRTLWTATTNESSKSRNLV